MNKKKSLILLSLILLMATAFSCGAPETKEETPLETLKTAFKDFNQPDSFKVEFTKKINEETYDIVAYVQGKDQCSEIKDGNSTIIRIVKGEKGYVYDWVTHEKSGKKTKISNSEKDNFDLVKNLKEGSPVLDNIASAKVEDLNGNQVVRVEFSDENGTIIERTWISTKYGIPLQEEYFDQDGQDIGTMKVISIEDGGDYTDKLVPNKEISWTEE